MNQLIEEHGNSHKARLAFITTLYQSVNDLNRFFTTEVIQYDMPITDTLMKVDEGFSTLLRQLQNKTYKHNTIQKWRSVRKPKFRRN